VSSKDLHTLLTKVEAAYTKRLLIAWYRDPESFSRLREAAVEEIIDQRRKMWP
jgi:hypothetical protein